MIKPEILACMKRYELLKRIEFINSKVKFLKKSAIVNHVEIKYLMDEKEQIDAERKRRVVK